MGAFVSPFVRIETVRVELGDGHWMDVKRELSVGDMRKIASASKGDTVAAGLHFLAAYLVDWSLQDANGQPVPVEPETTKLAALEAMTQDAFGELNAALTRHVEAVQAEKKASAPRGPKKSATRLSSAG